jgi:UDP-GlcNAc:undecaprenyl-phosphate GlcNAc-1-phosphate transferase
MVYAGIFFILYILEVFYFKIAGHFNITDTPNGRSSHVIVTLRGGGIIFPVSVLLYSVVFGIHYYFFTLGLLGLAVISFADDIKHQSRRLRALLQLIAVLFLLREAGLSIDNFFIWIGAAIVVISILNAYNFMDGINGMTACYSFTVMAALYALNWQLQVFDESLLLCVVAGNIVFTFFNFRKQARCFAGDVGSISMAYILLFLTTCCIVATSNPIFILFFALYIVDATLTILHRLYKKENIFEPHRQHLFQYMANEKKVAHLVVSGAYTIIQAVMSAGVLYVWKRPVMMQVMYAITVTIVLVLAYELYKYQILRKASSANTIASISE